MSCFTFVSVDCICTEQENFDPTISCNNLKKCQNQYFQSFLALFYSDVDVQCITATTFYRVSCQNIFVTEYFCFALLVAQSISNILLLTNECANCNNVSFGGICKHSIFKILRNKKLQLHELWQRQLHRTLGMKLIIYYLKRKEDRPHGGGELMNAGSAIMRTRESANMVVNFTQHRKKLLCKSY